MLKKGLIITLAVQQQHTATLEHRCDEETSFSRRAFLIGAGAALALPFIEGCYAIPDSWGIDGKYEYLIDGTSDLRIVLIGDLHNARFQKKVEIFVKKKLSSVDAVCLEGLSGPITPAYLDKISYACTHAQHLKDHKFKLMREVYKQKDNPGAHHLLLLLDLSPPTILSKEQCCSDADPILVASPGKHYALALSSSFPLFGVDDPELYREAIERVCLLFQGHLYSFYKTAKKDPASLWATTFLEQNLPLSSYATALECLLNKVNPSHKAKLPSSDRNRDFYRFILSPEREEKAVENITTTYSSGKIAVIMGATHYPGLLRRMKKKDIPVVMPCLPG